VAIATPLRTLIYDELHPDIKEALEALGLSVTFSPYLTPTEAANLLPEFDIIVGRTKLPLTAEVINQCPNLKLIVRAGAGLDDIDISFAESKGIAIINAPEGNRTAVGEHALGLILALLHKVVKSNNEVAVGIWNREANRGAELEGKTLGIIGLGNNGSSLAKRALAFDCKVIAYDKYLKISPIENVALVSLETLQAEADIVSLHIPLTTETHHLINTHFLNSLKKPIYFINVARGKLVDQNALFDALKASKVLGAALDVLENEKIINYNDAERQLLKNFTGLPNTIITPHIAGLTQESYLKINQIIVQKVRSFLHHSGHLH
jgi:D-3-phosphoglycerate dehydrogenase